MKLTILLAGVSLLASEAMAGNLSNVDGTLDTTLVDPAPKFYPHFICAGGCSGGSGGGGGAVTQSGVWSVGVSNFPAIQTVNGAVSVPGVATSANQPGLDVDGGGLAHITNFPSLQAISGTVTVGNLPAIQSVSGSVSISNLPVSQTVTGTVSVGNFPATQSVTGSVSVLGVATAANQPALDVDGGGWAHITNWPAVQSVGGAVAISNLPATQAVSGSVAISNLPASQPVTGTVSVGNFPNTQTISGLVTVPGVATAANQPGLDTDGGGLAHVTNWPSLQAVSGSVAISNLPANQAVTGSVTLVDPAPGLYPHFICDSGCSGGSGGDGGAVTQSGAWTMGVSNFPATQTVSGTVNVGNIPAVQPVNGTIGIGASVGFGSAGSPSAYVETVQGATGGTPIPVFLPDGTDVTLGSKGDAPTGSGSASVVSLLKQIHLDSAGAIPAGANLIGVVNLGAQTVFDTPLVSTVLESSHIFKTTGGQLTSAYVVSTAAGYLMVFNNPTAPADGAVTPLECIPVPANVATGISFAGLPAESYAVGITAVFSSTGCFTKTASATAFFHGAVQ